MIKTWGEMTTLTNGENDGNNGNNEEAAHINGAIIQQNRNNCILIAIICLAACSFGALLAAIWFFRKGDDFSPPITLPTMFPTTSPTMISEKIPTETPAANPTGTPTTNPTRMPIANPTTSLQAVADILGIPDLNLLDETSPEIHSLQWLAYYDILYNELLFAGSNQTIIERYALAVLYFAMNGPS